MDTKGQIGVFAIYLCMGFASGILYEAFAFLRLLCGCRNGKRVYIGGVIDVAFWLCAGIGILVLAYLFKLTTTRAYAWFGFVLGGIIYLKSLRRMVAFLENLCYNKYKSLRKKAKERKNTPDKVDEEV